VRTGEDSTLVFRRVMPVVESAALAILVALFVIKALLPAWASVRTDFPNYYIVARLLREHSSMDRIYEWIWLQRVKDHWCIPQPLVGFVGLTPFSALPIFPFTWLDVLEAKRAWLVVNIGLLCASIYGMHRLTTLGIRRVALIAFLAVIPMRTNFLLGQMHIVVLALLVLACQFHLRKRWLACSMTLAVAASLKVYPLLFVFYFLRKREWKAAAALAGGTIALFASCYLIFGAPMMHTFLMEQFPRMMRGEATDPFSVALPSASSFFHRLFLFQAQTNPHPLFSTPPFYALVYPLWQLGLFTAALLTISRGHIDAGRARLEWATWICLLLTLSTEPASYHKVVLILVVVLAVDAMESLALRIATLLCYFTACNAHFAIQPGNPTQSLLLDFIPYWALVALLGCLLAPSAARLYRTLHHSDVESAWRRPRFALPIAAFGTVWAIAAATTFAHIKTLNDPTFRAVTTSGSLAAFAPHRAGNHLFTLGMFLDGYRATDEDGMSLRTSSTGSVDDQLAIASSPNTNRIWIEAVNDGKSRLVEFALQADGSVGEPMATIADGESPALSTDGTRLVFLREVRGIGRAWMVRLDDGGKPVTAPVAVSPPEIDVRDADPIAQNAGLLNAAQTNAENAIGLRQEKRDGYLRLLATDLSQKGSQSGTAVQLTNGDCNAYDPAWLDATRVVYISDCGRGMGLGALAEMTIVAGKDDGKIEAARVSRSSGALQDSSR
jgi:hypothetical protein